MELILKDTDDEEIKSEKIGWNKKTYRDFQFIINLNYFPISFLDIDQPIKWQNNDHAEYSMKF
jgi:hypothetical protein